MIFCKDFLIPLPKSKLTEIFKKSSIAHKPHKFEQFQDAIIRIGKEINKTKIDEATQRLKEINKLIRNK